MKKEFSEYTSVKQCVVSQPAKIIIHFSQNVLNYLWCVKSILIKSVLPSSIFLFVLTILSVGFSTRFVFSKLLDSVPWLNIGIIILYIMSAVPSLITVFLIAPRYHYLTTQYHLFLLPIAILMYKIGKRASFSNQDLILSLIIVLLVFFNHYEIKNSEYVDRTKPNLSNIVLVERATKDIKKIVGVCTSGFLLQMARPDAKIFQIADLAKMLDQKSSLIIVVNQNQEADMPLAITSNFTKIAEKEVIIYIKK